MEDETTEEREQAELAAQEAAAIGGAGRTGAPVEALDTELDGVLDPSRRPVVEADRERSSERQDQESSRER